MALTYDVTKPLKKVRTARQGLFVTGGKEKPKEFSCSLSDDDSDQPKEIEEAPAPEQGAVAAGDSAPPAEMDRPRPH